MPWWAMLYLVFYYAFAMWSFVYHIHHDTAPSWFVIAEGTMDTGLLLVGLAYWKPHIVDSQLELLIMPMFVLGAAVFVGQLVFALRADQARGRRSIQGWLFFGISGAALMAIISGPLLFWGFQAAFLG